MVILLEDTAVYALCSSEIVPGRQKNTFIHSMFNKNRQNAIAQ